MRSKIKFISLVGIIVASEAVIMVALPYTGLHEGFWENILDVSLVTIVAATLALFFVRAEKKLVSNMAYLRTIIDSEPECVKVVSPAGRLLEINPSGLALLECDTIE